MNDSQKSTSKVNIITYKLLLIQNNFKYFGFRYAHYVLPYICVCVCMCAHSKNSPFAKFLYMKSVKNKYEATSVGNFSISI